MSTFLLLLSAVVAAVAAEAPAQAVAGFYFVAPPPSPPAPRVDLEKVTEDVMAQLKQIDGANSGSYHVYLPDGRLQQVTYTTAPLPSAAAEQLSQYKHHKPSFPSAGQFTFQNNQQANHQIVTGSNQQNSQSNQVKGKLVDEGAQPVNYVASVSYTDVQPITGPVYVHSEQPLNRIVRYAPKFA